MGLAHQFVERPILASVLSIVITLIGALAFFALPVTQYPEVAPPTIQVSAIYPGASAEVVAATVSTPLEQEINGVDNMLYMLSQATNDGRMTLTITFEPGTNLDTAQVLVQNRVAIAEALLPDEVRRLGVTTKKTSPDLMIVVHLFSRGGTFDELYVSNYALLQVRDVLSRIDGVGDVRIFGARDYSMRVWLDPDRVASFGLTAGDIVSALRSQNVQVASGSLNQEPIASAADLTINVQTMGRLVAPEEFGNIVVKAGDKGRLVRLRDVARVELGAQDQVTNSYFDDLPAVGMALFQKPGSNAIATAKRVKDTMELMSRSFPKGLNYTIAYNPTEFIERSIAEVYRTIFEATALVIIVIFLFLQSPRGALLPIVAIPISLVGTFTVMAVFGFSLNNLTLFGLVLAIGIVVDDAIVVIENIERNLRNGLSPKEAAHKTLDEVGRAVVSIGLVLAAVFIPSAFITGITGQFYRQFAITIAVATGISAFVSLTLSPALAALFLRVNHVGEATNRWQVYLRKFFRDFNSVFDTVLHRYVDITRWSVRRAPLFLSIFAVLIGLTAWQLMQTPTGFIPDQDQNYLIVTVQLPPATSLDRTDGVVKKAMTIIRNIDGVQHLVTFAGINLSTGTFATNAAVIFTRLDDFSVRRSKGVSGHRIVDQMRTELGALQDAVVLVFAPPPVRGIDNVGGFRLMVQDRSGLGLAALQQATNDLVASAAQEPGLTDVFTFFETSTPQLYVDIDRAKAEMLGVPVENVFDALEIYLGSEFVNDFNLLGRSFRVTVQADADYRQTPEDISRLRTRNDRGEMVPIGSVATFDNITAPSRVPRYNLYPAAEIVGNAALGVSSGEALATMERLASEILPPGIDFEWTELAFQEKRAANAGLTIFALSVIFVFLVLAAQYESWTLPLAVILIVPMCILFAITGIRLRGIDNNILVQIGFIVLIGLAAKNAILIVEFARQLEARGLDRFEAAVQAASLRLRPILMTSFAFIFGVVPLVVASGAGAEMRQALGTAVFSGMLGVTLFGLFLTPVFYVVCRRPMVSRAKAELARPPTQS